MITEDYVSFEVAELLKEKGFNLLCSACYDRFHVNDVNDGLNLTDFNNMDTRRKDIISAPTQAMAMKWLRETYNLEIYPYHNDPNNRHSSEWWFEIIKYPNSVAEYESGIDEEVDTYEEACEAAIKYCLENLI